MDAFLFLLGAIVIAVGIGSFKATIKTNRMLSNKIGHAHVVSKGVSMLMMVAETIQFVRVSEHASLVSIFAALFLLAIIAASKTGTEGDLP